MKRISEINFKKNIFILITIFLIGCSPNKTKYIDSNFNAPIAHNKETLKVGVVKSNNTEKYLLINKKEVLKNLSPLGVVKIKQSINMIQEDLILLLDAKAKNKVSLEIMIFNLQSIKECFENIDIKEDIEVVQKLLQYSIENENSEGIFYAHHILNDLNYWLLNYPQNNYDGSKEEIIYYGLNKSFGYNYPTELLELIENTETPKIYENILVNELKEFDKIIANNLKSFSEEEISIMKNETDNILLDILQLKYSLETNKNNDAYYEYKLSINNINTKINKILKITTKSKHKELEEEYILIKKVLLEGEKSILKSTNANKAVDILNFVGGNLSDLLNIVYINIESPWLEKNIIYNRTTKMLNVFPENNYLYFLENTSKDKINLDYIFNYKLDVNLKLESFLDINKRIGYLSNDEKLVNNSKIYEVIEDENPKNQKSFYITSDFIDLKNVVVLKKEKFKTTKLSKDIKIFTKKDILNIKYNLDDNSEIIINFEVNKIRYSIKIFLTQTGKYILIDNKN